jgi:hypothetical protein
VSFRDEVQQAIEVAYRGLNPEERQMAKDTRWRVADHPSPEELAMVNAQPGDIVLGMYVKDAGEMANTVSLYSENILSQGLPAWAVVEHEMTHVLGYDHTIHDHNIAHACGISRGQVLPGPADNCPVCKVYAEIAQATGLLEDLRDAIGQGHNFPPGLAGTIPQARFHLLTAQHTLEAVRGMLPDRGGEVANVRQCLMHILFVVADQVPPEKVAAAAQLTRSCRMDAHRLAQSYWMNRHPAGMG